MKRLSYFNQIANQREEHIKSRLQQEKKLAAEYLKLKELINSPVFKVFIDKLESMRNLLVNLMVTDISGEPNERLNRLTRYQAQLTTINSLLMTPIEMERRTQHIINRRKKSGGKVFEKTDVVRSAGSAGF